MNTNDMLFRVTGDATDEWEGTLEELLEQNPELPELVERRLESLRVGEVVRPPVGADTFEVTRLS
jgi:hypothetical protein